VAVDFGGTPIIPLQKHQLHASRKELADCELLNLDWEHPDDRDPSVKWAISSVIARKDHVVQAAFLLKVGSIDFIVRPTNYTVGRPRVVTDILSSCPCTINGTPVPTMVTTLPVDAVSRFTNSTLFSPQRPLPVLMVSKDPFTENPIVDPEQIQAQLLGFAQVVLLENKWAAFVLSDIVGKELSCYNGAVRLYWPGLTPESDPMGHPLYLPQTLRQHAEAGQELHRYLFRRLTGISALRYAEGTVIGDVRRSFEQQQQAHTEQLRTQLSSREVDYEQVCQGLETAWDENSRLKKDLESASARVVELTEEIEELKGTVATFWRYREEEETSQESEASEEEIEEPTTVLDALKQAAEQFSEHILAWDSALEAAEHSDFDRPTQVYQALMAVAEVAREHYAARQEGRSIGPWEQAFQRRGFKYAANEHQNTLTMFGKHRDFTHQGQTKRMLKHITLGGGDTRNCLQIYFEPNDSTGRIDIGHCGRHLPYKKQRT